MMSDLFEHFPDLPIASFMQSHFQPGIVTLPDKTNFRGSGPHAASTLFCNGNPLAKFLQLRIVGLTGNFHDISLRHIRCRFHECVGECPVIVDVKAEEGDRCQQREIPGRISD